MPSASLLFLPFLATVLFMFALRPVARGLGLIDLPGGRKAHLGEIPVIGGLAMLVGVILGGVLSGAAAPNYSFFLAAIIILVVIGALDDRYDLPASVRLMAQLCAALIMMYGADLMVKDLGHVTFAGMVELGWFAPVFTILIVVTAINSFNMFDGSDGVAGIQSLMALVFLGFACIVGGNFHSISLIESLVGAVFGFLVFNWPSKRTRNVRAFMGDAGSTMLGFALAWLSVDLSQGPERVISPMVALWVFGLPIFDFFSNMIRRVRAGRSPFHADAEHLHHILRRHGFSARRVAQIILLAAAVFGAVGVGGHFVGVSDGVLLVAWLATYIGYFCLFGSGLVIKRRSYERIEDEDHASTGSFSMWRQRR
jgi:UDP-GlcNAc:undecaprenyl-phosphate GlcNAc-1-phosphate transferase